MMKSESMDEDETSPLPFERPVLRADMSGARKSHSIPQLSPSSPTLFSNSALGGGFENSGMSAIELLTAAESAANEMVQKEIAARSRTLQQAKVEAAAEIQAFREAKEAAFQLSASVEDSFQSPRVLKERTSTEIQDVERMFHANKAKVQTMMVDHATTVVIKVPAARTRGKQ